MIVLSQHPVTTSGGVTYNIFAGFQPVEFTFTRQDVTISTVTAGAGGKISVKVAGDITSDLNENESVYIYSVGIGYTYDKSGEVINLTFSGGLTTLLIDIDYIVSTSGGYMNYYQNYNLQMKLTSPTNFNIDLLGFSLQNDGTDSGNIVIDTSIINDVNTQNIITESCVVTDGRKKYNVKYRQSWRDNTSQTWITVDNPIIVVYATEQPTIKEFSTPFNLPKIWLGYPAVFGLFHSNANESSSVVQILFDELDINQSVLTSDNLLNRFKANDYGLLAVIDPYGSFTFDADVNYLMLKASYEIYGEFNPTEFNNTEFNT